MRFAVENAATTPADELSGTFTVANVAGFSVSGASLPTPIDAGQSYDGLTAAVATGAFGSTAPIKFGANEETITYHPQDTNPSGYSATLRDLTLTIDYDLVQANNVFSYAYGDVHIITYNGLHYDFQASGDFTLAKSRVAGDSFDIQLRLQPWYNGASVSVITQVAVSVGDDRVTFDWSRPNTVMVDSAAATLSLSNPTLTLAGGQVTELSPDSYTVTWNTGETTTVTRGQSFLDYFVNVADSVPVGQTGFIAGLQGEDEGQANDFQLADGTVLPQPLTSAQLYGPYANAWAVTSANSLFDTPAIPPSAPADPLTLADLPQNAVNQAAQMVAAAGITDPNIAADAELDYLATGDPAFIASAQNISQQGFTTTAASVTPSTTPVAAAGVMAAQTSVTEAASGPTAVTFDVYLTSKQGSDTPVNYTVIAPQSGDLGAAAFGGTFPSGQVTITAGQTTTQFTINVPQGALGAVPSEDLDVQISSPGGVPIFAPTAQTEIVNNKPEAGSPAVVALAELSGQGTLAHSGNNYTLNLGTLTHGQLLQPLQFAIINAATAPADSLAGTFGVPTGNGFTVTGNNLTTPIAAGQNYQGLFFTEQTNVDGAHSESLSFTPDDVNDSAYSQALPQITLTVTDNVVPAAQARTNTPATVFFPNVRVGTAESQEVSVTNTATSGAANLDVSLTASGDTTANGSVTGLAPSVTDYTDLSVGLNTGSGGAKGGSVIEDFVSDLGGGNTMPIVPSSYIDIFGSVYRVATASITPTSGIVHVGDPGTSTLTVANTDTTDGYSENLIAALTGTSGNIGITGGPTGEIGANSSDTTTFMATFSTTQAAIVSGTATFNLTSDGGTGNGSIDGLGQLALGQQTVPLSITVDNYANPVFEEISGGGTFSQNGSSYTLDLGTITQAPGSLAIDLGVLNNVAGPADQLSGSFQTSGSSAFSLSGFGAFSGLGAGQADTASIVTLDTSQSGTVSETITLAPTGSNASGYSQTLSNETLTIEGTIASAAPVLTGQVTLSAATEGTALANNTTVATFTDSNTSDTAGAFTATINWGDGAPTSMGTVTGANGLFSITGGHTYADEGSDTLSVTIAEPNGPTITPSGTVKVGEGDSLTPHGTTISASANTPFNGTVATFSDSYTANPASDFTATINWGDGSPATNGTISGGNGTFTVTGSHTYTATATDTAKVTLSDDAPGTATATATTTAYVGAVLAGAVKLNAATEGTALANNTTVATFTDSNLLDTAGGFTTTINWGDGTAATTGTVMGANGLFTVAAGHTYADEGSETLTTTIIRAADNTQQTLVGSLAVAEGDALTPHGAAINASPNQALTNVVVANFTDSGTANAAGDFAATINWGDGSAATTGIVTGSNGTFAVSGTHTYTTAATDTVKVTLSDDAPGTASAAATTTAYVGAILGGSVKLTAATEGMTLATNTTIASFTDSNLLDTAGGFTATINWGDGTPATTGTVMGANGLFTVAAGHTYADEGSDALTMTITRTDGTTLPLQGTVKVAEGDALTPHGTTISASPNTPFSGTVATFGDSYTGNVPGDFTASINWGDGSPPTNGTISGGNGTLTVTGSHTYTVAATDTVKVTLSEDAPGTATATATSTANAAQKGFMSAVPDAAGYAVLSEGTGDRLHLANTTVNGNIGVGGTGSVQFDGPGAINGRLDFSAANNGQYKDNGNNSGATSVNYGVAAVTSALNEVNALSTSLGKEKGANIAISGNMTINASAGILDANGNRVFNVTSYSEGNGNVVTINGDAAGDSVVFNFGFNSNVNLGGDVTLVSGLSDDQVLWNFTTSGKHIDLNTNASSAPLPLAFHGIILAPLDNLSMENSNLDGRLWGGGSGNNMQVVGGDTLNDFVPALTAGYWSGHHNTNGVQWDEATLTGYGKGVLLGDDTGAAWEGGGTATNPQTLAAVPAGMLFVPDAAAGQLIGVSPPATDVRAALLSQAIAGQLNIDTGIADPGYSPGTPPNGHDLIGEAVKWLTGQVPFQYADGSTGNIDTNHDGVLETGAGGSLEYNTATASFTSPAQLTSTAAWNAYVDPVNAPPQTGDITVNGQDLKNALQAFNANQLVTAMNSFQVGWNSNGVAGDMHPNTSDTFWSVLKDQHVIAGPVHA